MAVYKWKVDNLFPVSAQVAGETIEEVQDALGKENIEPQDLLDASRPINAPLHPCFEWDDEIAAEKYRLKQAGSIIRNITVTIITRSAAEITTRAFVNVSDAPCEKGNFIPIKLAMENADYRANILGHALAELRNFQHKYTAYRELAKVFAAIEEFAQELKAD